MNPFRAPAIALLFVCAAACDPIVLVHARVTVAPGEPLPPAASLRIELAATPVPPGGPERPLEARMPSSLRATPDGRGYEFDVTTGIGRCFRVRLRVWADANHDGQLDPRELVGQSAEAFDVCRAGAFADARHDAPPIALAPFQPPP